MLSEGTTAHIGSVERQKIKMDFLQEGQRQCLVFCGEKAAEGRKSCVWSWRRCFYLLLVTSALLFFYGINTNEKLPNWSTTWWRKSNSTNWLDLFHQQSGNSLNASDFNAEISAAGASAASATQTVTSSHVIHRSTEGSQQTTVATTPVPYKSPGLYVVEYPYKYQYIINEPNKCEQQNPFVVLVVPVAPKNRAHRDVIRSTWGNESLVLDKVVKLFFLLGLHSGDGAQEVQEQLLEESKEHGDVIQSSFLDCYKNLTIKTMVMLEWLDSYCSNASYAMKIDSDMFLNVPNLINMLSNSPKTNFLTGLVATSGLVLRNKNSKWYLPEDVFPEAVYPPYALGLGYVLSLDLPRKLVEASRHVTPVYIEDVFVGLCMRYLGIPPTNPPNGGSFHVFPVAYSRCAYSTLIATTTNEHTDLISAWKDFKKPGPYC